MISFFSRQDVTFAIQHQETLSTLDIEKLTWLFANAQLSEEKIIHKDYIGPRAAMITPWSTNAVEITQNMGVKGIARIERFLHVGSDFADFDPMISQRYTSLDQAIFKIDAVPADIEAISDIGAYNLKEGLSLSEEEVKYLENLSLKMGRPLTDSEVFGFSQVNSEHCRHKIFNGTFIIDGVEQGESLFTMIKKTSKENPNYIVSAYKDNVAFIEGPRVEQFAPLKADEPSLYKVQDFESVISLKAETHNFPTTVEPFNGAATGSGGEIRDRLAGGRGSIPMAGTAVYMTSYSRLLHDRPWERSIDKRKWLYQTPLDILIKASNGASDFGNKFGQPLIAGSLLTFEHQEFDKLIAYDKVIMQAGGIGYGKKEMAAKNTPKEGDRIVILGGDNYRIGMGGAAVSSADTGAFESGIELNAVQRSNPEMQKRAANTVRALLESDTNPIVSIHDHGAGGHLNCLSELVEDTGGHINVSKLPLGDPTLSDKEIIGNESQERMGLVIAKEDIVSLKRIAERERSPMYDVGVVTSDDKFIFHRSEQDKKPMDLKLSDMFGSSPKTVLKDHTSKANFEKIETKASEIYTYTKNVLRLESVACKDWLTNKVDRCVGGLVAAQQCVGPLQLPLNNVAVMALDFNGKKGIATSIGHAPSTALIDAAAGSRVAITEALTNIIWAPLENDLRSISLSANWMWPCKNPGQDTRLYQAVKATSDFAISLGINIPTGKDSLSMAQKYEDKTVLAPGTVIISACGQCSDIRKVIEPVLQPDGGKLYYLNFSQDVFKLGGSSLAQTLNRVGEQCPDVKDAQYVIKAFNAIQHAIQNEMIQAGHDIASGGMITSLLELCFAQNGVGLDIKLDSLNGEIIDVLFSENPGILIQASDDFAAYLDQECIQYHTLGNIIDEAILKIRQGSESYQFDIATYRDCWYETSFLLDQHQTAGKLSSTRYENYKYQPLEYTFPAIHTGAIADRAKINDKPLAAIIREKGSNSEREMANALYRAGFEVRDVHMTDLITGRETLEDVRFIGAVGGFSNSDVLGSAKGWAGAFKFNKKAKEALDRFFARPDTLSIGICNGCQLFLELDLINPDHKHLSKMTYNDSRKHESAFTSVRIHENTSVMMHNLAGAQLGVWISHGEGKFSLPMDESEYHIVSKYSYDDYPHNPNGSDYNVAMLASKDGRHLVTMPHIERSFFAWNWAHYKAGHKDDVSPWAQAFVNARDWLMKK